MPQSSGRTQLRNPPMRTRETELYNSVHAPIVSDTAELELFDFAERPSALVLRSHSVLLEFLLDA